MKLWLSRQDAAGIVEQVDRAASEAVRAAHAQPGTRALHAANPPYRLQPGGAYLFQFKSKPRPVLRDSAGNELTHCARIGDGSRIACTYTLEPFTTLDSGAGVQLRLHEVQLIELVAWQPPADGSGFQRRDYNTLN